MAHSKTLSSSDVLCKIVYFFEILHLFMSLWDFTSVEIRGLVRRPSRYKLKMVLYTSKLYHLRLRTYIEYPGYLVEVLYPAET